jgi:hypothetical protein
MILKASERGGAKQLAAHLLNTQDNEHIHVHEVRGFVSDDVTGAFKESYAVSQGTRCKNHLFSLSLSPPQHEHVPTEIFENTLERIEQRTGLTGHPRVVVFHEKDGRRHAHCVWSRIDAETMTAKNLSHYKNKLQAISREIHHEQNWKLPNGLIRGESGDPKNYTLAQWQQCKRMGRDARDLKGMMQDCWAASDSPTAFASALKERGLILAKGDRRGHVAVTHEGEVLSIARYVGRKAREVRERLGDPKALPDVEATKAQIAKDMRGAFTRHAEEVRTQRLREKQRADNDRAAMTALHRKEREQLEFGQRERRNKEARERANRLNKGLKSIWQRVTGQHKRIQQQNEQEAFAAFKRDQAQRESLIFGQLQDRRNLEAQIRVRNERRTELLRDIRNDQKRYRQMQRDPMSELQENFKVGNSGATLNQNERLEKVRHKKLTPRKPRVRGPEIERS